MQGIFILFILGTLAFTGFLFYLIKSVKDDNYDNSLRFLNIMVKFGLIIYIGSSIIFTFIALFYIGDFVLITVTVIKQMITTIFFILIYKKTMNLLDNLNTSKIFLLDNAIFARDIGLYFLYLSVTEILAGFALGILFINEIDTFTLSTNSTIFVYIIIGLVLQIFSKILIKAVQIHNENQLTI